MQVVDSATCEFRNDLVSNKDIIVDCRSSLLIEGVDPTTQVGGCRAGLEEMVTWYLKGHLCNKVFCKVNHILLFSIRSVGGFYMKFILSILSPVFYLLISREEQSRVRRGESLE